MRDYWAIVAENNRQMGTDNEDWLSLPIHQADANGEPLFGGIPAGYKRAATIFPTRGEVDHCELCSHDIKNAHWLYNPVARVYLLVGSECVTHYEPGTPDSEAMKLRKSAIAKAAAETLAERKLTKSYPELAQAGPRSAKTLAERKAADPQWYAEMCKARAAKAAASRKAKAGS